MNTLQSPKPTFQGKKNCLPCIVVNDGFYRRRRRVVGEMEGTLKTISFNVWIRWSLGGITSY